MQPKTQEFFGFEASAWENAKSEAIRAIVRAGCNGDLISYSDLARQIPSIALEPHSYAMDRLLDEVSKEEDAAGRGILTALVVLKDEGMPGAGFWATATDIGRDVRDRITFWANEVARVMKECQKRPLYP